MYAELAYNDLKVKAGRFYTPIGYEVVQAPTNFFYSHSYSHTFGEPFTHTGILAAYHQNEKTTVYGGWVNGWDEGWEGLDGGSMFLGGLSFNLSDKATLAWFLTAGQFGDAAHRAQQFVEFDHHLGLAMPGDQALDVAIGALDALEAQGLVAGQHLHAVGAQRLGHQGRDQRRHRLARRDDQADLVHGLGLDDGN